MQEMQPRPWQLRRCGLALLRYVGDQSSAAVGWPICCSTCVLFAHMVVHHHPSVVVMGGKKEGDDIPPLNATLTAPLR